MLSAHKDLELGVSAIIRECYLYISLQSCVE